MIIIHEGEILLKEKYGSSTNERFYVKPPEQSGIVVFDEGKRIDPYSWVKKIFLPHGYPQSVSKDYTAYQIWDTAQAFCSTITGTLATQEVLRGVGVGDKSATPLAATVTWVIKDGCGHLGRIFFACFYGTHLDAYSKKWRLYADVLNDAAMCIEISLPLFKNHTTFALCVSTAMKAVVGVAGGATRAALTQHHALCGNLADVAAKDSAQETAVNLIASIVAVFMITVFGNSITLFLFTMVLHITFNYLAVRAVCLRSLNEPRYLQVISSYIKNEVIASPCEVNRQEPIVLYQVPKKNDLDFCVCGFQIKLGSSIKKLTNNNFNYAKLDNIMKAYSERRYLLCPTVGDRCMFVLLSENANTDDILCAYFHAVLLSIVICAINSEPLSIYEDSEVVRPFTRICQTLQAADWSRISTDEVGFSGFVYEPSFDLIKFLNKVVQKEWKRFRTGLVQTGWDLSKHLLLSDEWRISCPSLEQKSLASKDVENEKYTMISDIPSDLDKILESSNPEQLANDTFIIEPDGSDITSSHTRDSETEPMLLRQPSSLKKQSSMMLLNKKESVRVVIQDKNDTKGSAKNKKDKDKKKSISESSEGITLKVSPVGKI